MNNELISVKKYNKSLDYLENLEQFCLKCAFVDYYGILGIWNKIPDKIKVEILPTLIKDFSLYKNESEANAQNVDFIGNIWLNTPLKVQKKSIKSVILSLIESEDNKKMAEMQNLDALLFATTHKSLISNSITKILDEIGFLDLINEDEVCKKLYSYLPKTMNYSFFNILKINQKKAIIKLDKSGAEKLLNKLSNHVPVILEIENASELSNEEINKFLNNGVNIKYVNLKNSVNNNELPYNLKTYMACRKKIDDIIKNVGYTVNQKELFVKITKEISKIHYSSIIEEIAQNGELSHFDLNNKYKYNHMYDSCSNLEGLITGKAICGGYVEIMNNIMSCCGIKCIGIVGDESLKINHIWNQINLDGEWYNADVTYDAENIEKQNVAYWLLKSDKDFITDIDGKSVYRWHSPSQDLNDEIHSCPKSVPYSEINFYLNNSSFGSSDEQIKNHSTIKDKLQPKEKGER